MAASVECPGPLDLRNNSPRRGVGLGRLFAPGRTGASCCLDAAGRAELPAAAPCLAAASAAIVRSLAIWASCLQHYLTRTNADVSFRTPTGRRSFAVLPPSLPACATEMQAPSSYCAQLGCWRSQPIDRTRSLRASNLHEIPSAPQPS